MPGLVPGIPIRKAMPCLPKRDGRDKPGHDNAVRNESTRLVMKVGISCD
jgi:hypothetical protein